MTVIGIVVLRTGATRRQHNGGCSRERQNRSEKRPLEAGIDEDEVVPDHGDAQDEGVDAVEDAAVAGEEAAGIFDAGGALTGGFEEVAHLSCDVAENGHDEEMREWDVEPPVECISN